MQLEPGIKMEYKIEMRDELLDEENIQLKH